MFLGGWRSSQSDSRSSSASSQDYSQPRAPPASIPSTPSATNDSLGQLLTPAAPASFGSGAVRVNTETVYSGRCEAGVVMTSVSDYATYRELKVLLEGARAVRFHLLGELL